MRGTKKQNEKWIKEILGKKELLYELSDIAEIPVPRWMMDALYIKGLDGDDPDEFPELTKIFYNRSKKPIKWGFTIQRRWLRGRLGL